MPTACNDVHSLPCYPRGVGREGSAHGVQVVASPVPCRGFVRCGVVAASKNEELFSFGLTKIKTFACDAGLLNFL